MNINIINVAGLFLFTDRLKTGLIEWFVTDGQDFAEELNFILLPDNVLEKVEASFDNIAVQNKISSTTEGVETTLTESSFDFTFFPNEIFPIELDLKKIEKINDYFEESTRNFIGGYNTDITAITSVVPTTTLPNGIASGDTTKNSTVLWTRSTELGDVTFEYSTAPDFSTIAGTKTATVTAPELPVKVELTGLLPGTNYYYRVTDAVGTEAVGKFVTAASLGEQKGLRFGVSGDWRGELAPYPAISNAVERELAFFVEHGDTIYADFPSPAVPKEQAETLTEYRAKQAEVYGSRFGENFWGDLRASTSILATIDDHEVTNDFAGGAPAASDPRFGTTEGLINDTQLYENGLQAFQEYNPLRDEFYGNTGEVRTEDERQLYRFNTYGSDAAVMVLDSRSFRDEELPGVSDPNDPTQVGAFLAASFDPSRTMLGQQQLSDLKQDLLEAQQDGITWKFIMVPEPIQNLGVIGASDRFEGYAAERTEILQFIDENEIDNVVFVAADIHATVVNNLTYQESLFGPQIATDTFEVTTGSVAFDAPFGPTLIEELARALGISTFLPLKELYNALPSTVQEAIIQRLLNGQIEPLGYDPVGLDNNLAISDGLVDAKLLQGGYTATNTFGWTEFDINPVTQTLTVTTYGIEPYSQEDLLTSPQSIIERNPTIVSQFEVYADLHFNGGNGQDLLRGGGGDDTITGGNGKDTVQYEGLQSDYTFWGVADNFTVQGEGIGKDTLTEIEFLNFTGDNTIVATASLFT